MARGKSPSGRATESGRAYADERKLGIGQVRGLTDADIAGLIIVEDNTEAIIEALGTLNARALEEIGLVAEGYAKKLCPVDTGRLRNSITHSIQDGEYKFAVIGTNVEYGPYIELGTSRRDAANGGRGFLRPAAQDHGDVYRQIVEKHLKG